MNVVPIDNMRDNSAFSSRFSKGKYDPMIARNEVALLDAKQGGNLWLIGERLDLIKRTKAFKEWGFSSFEEYVEEGTPYSRSAAYAYINVCTRFNYSDAVKHGSKLQLIPAYVTEEADVDQVISDIADKSYREARDFLRGEEEPAAEKETEAEYTEDEEDDKTIVVRKGEDEKHEAFLPVFSKIQPKKITRDGAIVFKDEVEAKSLKPYNVIISWKDQREYQAFNKVIDSMWNVIRKRMLDELNK